MLPPQGLSSFQTFTAFEWLMIYCPVNVGVSLWVGWRINHEKPNLPAIRVLRPAWNKGRIIGQKLPLKPKHVWAICLRLELAESHRDLDLFNLAIDRKLRGCDLVRIKAVDVMAAGQIKDRASVLQSKTQKPVRFEISEGTRASIILPYSTTETAYLSGFWLYAITFSDAYSDNNEFFTVCVFV